MSSEPIRDRITDLTFRRAVDLIDEGEAELLADFLAKHPQLITQRVKVDDQGYFAEPCLLNFIAENPIRHDQIPERVVDVTRAILEAGAKDDQEAMDVTIGLVATGCRPREGGKQIPLIELLLAYGASPDCISGALMHGEQEAAEVLIAAGATVELWDAAALGDLDLVKEKLADKPDQESLQKAIAAVAYHGQWRVVEPLVNAGADVNAFNPHGFHGHSTPLHQAAICGGLETVVALLKHGARTDIKDLAWGATPYDWAVHEKADPMVINWLRVDPAIYDRMAVLMREGQVDELGALLTNHRYMMNVGCLGNTRKPLHVAADCWPGNFPNVGKTIDLLVEFGADPNVAYEADGKTGETPLHWSASCDDVEAIEALLRNGADINALGGVITGGTPLHDAVIFNMKKAQKALLAAGAAYDLWIAAGSNRHDLVLEMFDKSGNLRTDAPAVPGMPEEDPQFKINWSFFVCCNGNLETAKFLYPKISEHGRLPDGKTMLDLAIQHKETAMVDYLRSIGLKTCAEMEASNEQS